MISLWKGLLSKLLSQPSSPANEQLAQRLSEIRMKEYPNSYKPGRGDGQESKRPEVFEPALKHYLRAFRLGDPIFQDSETGQEWAATRLRVIDHLLKLIGGSRWHDNLTLRGSLLLKAWLGEAAREPGDIDWVLRPKTLSIDALESRQLFDDIIRMVEEHPHAGGALLEISEISVDDIWTYERVPGRRIVFPWRAPGLPPGEVQMDVVFGEELFAEPLLTPIPLTDGGSVLIWSVGKEISLAWKLLWLEMDMYPQGKDLYDATLLAEQTQLSFDLLFRVLQSGDYLPKGPLQPDFPMHWGIDWDNFKKEYPDIEGTAEDWQARLTRALAPTFAIYR